MKYQFIERLKKAGIEYQNPKYGLRILNNIYTKSGYTLSIQCSRYHYCFPKEFRNIEDYSAYEVSISKNGRFIYPEKLKKFKRKKELDECAEGIGLYSQPYVRVPIDLVEDLYIYLNS